MITITMSRAHAAALLVFIFLSLVATGLLGGYLASPSNATTEELITELTTHRGYAPFADGDVRGLYTD